MIDVYINGEALDKSPGFTIQLELASPLFSDVIGYSSHSLSFRLPLTPRNRAIFQQADSVLNYQGQESYDAVVYLGGERWREGLLNIGGFAIESVYVSLDLSEGTFSRLLREKSLRDYSYGGDRVIAAIGANENITFDAGNPEDSPTIIHANDTTTGDVDSHDYVFFPVNHPPLYGDDYVPDVKVTEQNGVYPFWSTLDEYTNLEHVNWWRPSGGFWDKVRQFYDYFPVGDSEYSKLGIHTLAPYPYLVYVLKQVTKELGYQLEEAGGFLDDTEIRTLAILNPVTIDRLYEVELPVSSTQVTASEIYTTNGHSESINLKRHMPAENSQSFWINVSRLFGLVTIVNSRTVKLVCKKDQVNALNQIDWTKKVQSYSHKKSQVNCTFGTNADSGDILDTETIKTEDIDVTGEVEKQTNLPIGTAVGRIYYVKDENAFYKYDIEEQGEAVSVYEWKLLGYRNDAVVIGTGSDDKTNSLAVTQQYEGPWVLNSTTYVDVDWSVPIVKMPLISPAYQLPPYDFGAKLCFYRGMQENADGYEYPKGSSDADIVNGFNYSLRWTGDGNLYDTWHKDWVEMLQRSRDMTLYLNLDITDIFDFDWLSKPRITVEDGQAVTIIKSLTVKISDTGIETTEAEAIRI